MCLATGIKLSNQRASSYIDVPRLTSASYITGHSEALITRQLLMSVTDTVNIVRELSEDKPGSGVCTGAGLVRA